MTGSQNLKKRGVRTLLPTMKNSSKDSSEQYWDLDKVTKKNTTQAFRLQSGSNYILEIELFLLQLQKYFENKCILPVLLSSTPKTVKQWMEVQIHILLQYIHDFTHAVSSVYINTLTSTFIYCYKH